MPFEEVKEPISERSEAMKYISMVIFGVLSCAVSAIIASLCLRYLGKRFDIVELKAITFTDCFAAFYAIRFAVGALTYRGT